jgi:hypothetical protein
VQEALLLVVHDAPTRAESERALDRHALSERARDPDPRRRIAELRALCARIPTSSRRP